MSLRLGGLALASVLPLLAGGALCAPPGEGAAAPPALPVLRTISAIRSLSLDEAARGHPVRIRGIVTYNDESTPFGQGLIIHDGAAGQFVVFATPHTATLSRADLHIGDRIEIVGHTRRGGFAPNVQPERVRRLGRAPLPAPRRVPYSDLLTGRHDCDYLEIVGTGQRAWRSEPPSHNLFLDVAVEGGTVRASFWDFADEDLSRLIDARVRIRGNVGALFGQTEQLRGVSLLCGRTRDIVVEEPPPDPFSLPVRAINSIYKHASGDQADRRIRVHGVVTYESHGHEVRVRDFASEATFRYVPRVFYVSDGTSGVRVETRQGTSLRAGDVVDVAAFPRVTPTKPTLRNAVFKRLGREAEPQPVPLSPDSLLEPDNDAELVRVEGQLLGVVTSPTERVLILKTGDTAFDAGLGTGLAGRRLLDIRPGSLVSLTGVHSLQIGPPPSFRLLLRSANDVHLLRAAPWWTTQHTLVLLAIVGLLAAGAVTWGRMVANRNVLMRQQYQVLLTERSRLARELHDTLEQGLAGVKLQLEAVAGSLDGTSSRARSSLDLARQMLLYCLDEARRSVMDLRSRALERGDLLQALTDLARQMTTGTELSIDVRVFGSPRRLDGPRENHLLRIGAEALTNVLKHSGARQAELELTFGADAIGLVVRDDGVGYPSSVGELRTGHFGLRGIRERVEKLSGTLRIENRPVGGAELAVSVPARGAAPVADATAS